MKKIKLRMKMMNMFLALLAFMATAGANNFSVAGLHQPKKPEHLYFK